MIGAGAGVVVWLTGRGTGNRSLTAIGLAAAAVVGGALAALAPVATTFPAVAALGAAIEFEAPVAVPIAATGAGAFAVASAAYGRSGGFMLQGALVAVVGLMVGASRRGYVQRAVQAERLLAERHRADAERDRAAALAERNRIGREIHDVLAHSLGAMAVQLDAAGAVLGTDADVGRARQLVEQARQLAVEGLEESRRAVRALREEPVALPEQLAALLEHDGAPLRVTGVERALPPDAGLALYRAAQEAVTNARKHAPGAPIEVRLDFEPARTVLTVTNGPAPAANAVAPIGSPRDLASTGGGFGLQGMIERVQLLGGTVEAGRWESGYRVQAAVPA